MPAENHPAGSDKPWIEAAAQSFYRPETEREIHYYPAVLPEHFDE